MENKIWAKTLLDMYKYFETISETIEESAKKEAHKSIFLTNPNSTYEIGNRILKLNERKKNIINLKILVEDMVAKLGKLDIQIITLNMLQGIKSQTVCDMLGMTMRTFFRRKKSAIESLGKIFGNMGYSNNRMIKDFVEERWLFNTFESNKINESQIDNSDNIRQGIVGNLLREFKNPYAC